MYCHILRETQLQNIIKIGDKTVRLRKRKWENICYENTIAFKI